MTSLKTPLETSIEQLLQRYECVILPEFGGFIVRDSPCNFNAEKNKIKPFARNIFFNPHLIENDGLLVSEIQKSEALNYADANSLCLDSIKSLKLDIESLGSKHFGNLGTFFKGQDNIWFAPSPALNLSLDSYGLQAVDASKLESIEIEQIEQEVIAELEPKSLADNAPIEKMTVTKTNYGAWLVAASVALIAHFIYLNFENKDSSAHEASVLPSSIQIGDENNNEEIPTVEETLVDENTVSSETIEPAEDNSVFNNEPTVSTPETNQTNEPIVEAVTEKVAPIEPEFNSSKDQLTEISEPIAEVETPTQVEPEIQTERVVAKYRMQTNADFHAKDLIQLGKNAFVKVNGQWFEVITKETIEQ
ncbi:MAG: hypothetical protein R2852_01760 [Bacteroidia bacterium]